MIGIDSILIQEKYFDGNLNGTGNIYEATKMLRTRHANKDGRRPLLGSAVQSV